MGCLRTTGRAASRRPADARADGPDATTVTEVYDCSRAPAEAQADMAEGEVWAESMARTLERLAAACARTDRS